MHQKSMLGARWAFFAAFFFIFWPLFGQNATAFEAELSRLESIWKSQNPATALAAVDSILTNSKKPPAVSPAQRAELFSLKGRIFRQSGDPRRALVFHQKALAERQKAFGKNSVEAGRSIHNLGNCWQDLGDLDRAAAFWSQNLEILEKKLGSNCPEAVAPLKSLADFHFQKGRPDRSVELYERAFSIRKAAPDGLATVADATLLNNLGNAWAALGAFGRAVERQREGLEILEKLTGQPPNVRAERLQNLANSELDLGDFEAAFWHFRAAVAVADVGSAAWANALGGLALVHRLRGETGEAQRLLSLAIEAFFADPAASRRSLAGAFRNLGACFLDEKDVSAAAFYFEKSLNEWLKIPTEKAEISSAWTKLGIAQKGANHFEKAHESFKKALFSAQSAASATVRFEAFFQTGDLFLEQIRLADAESFFEKAVAALGPQAAPFEAARARAALAVAANRRAKAELPRAAFFHQKALENAEKGAAFLDDLKSRAREEQSESELQDLLFDLFGAAVEAEIGLGRPEKAFAWAERGKTSFSKKLARRTARAALPAALAAEAERIEGELAFFQKNRQARLESLAGSGAESSPSARQSDEKIAQLLAQRQKLRGQIEAQRPDFLAALEPKTLAPEAARAALEADETLLEFQCCDGGIALFLMRRDTFLTVFLPDAASLEKDAAEFQAICRTNPEWLEDAEQARSLDRLAMLGRSIYERLLAPVEPFLTQKLALVPDAWLFYLPFEALLTARADDPSFFKEQRFLGFERSIRTLFSALGLVSLPQKGMSAGRLLAVAPSFEGDSRQLLPLAYSAREAAEIAREMGGDFWEGAAARAGNFEKAAGDYRVLHLSTHGVLNDGQPEWSYLAFSQTGDSAAAAASFSVFQIARLRLGAEMVVLSACQSANGRLLRGEGLRSLAQAFSLAGARSVVAAFWNVDDRETPRLMRGFYAFLNEKMGKSAALAAAKKQYVAESSGLKGHPFFWAGFVQIGDDAPLSFAEKGGGVIVFWLLAMGFFALLAVVFFIRKKAKINPNPR